MSVAGVEAGRDLGHELQFGSDYLPDAEQCRAIGAAAFDHAAALYEQLDPFDDLVLSLDMAAALATLPPKQREVLRLRYVEGLTVDAVASRLCIPVGTASTRSWHAIHNLQAYFTPPGESQPVI